MKILKRWQYLALLLLMPFIMAPTYQPENLAAANWVLNSVSQTVEIDGEEVEFEAYIHVCANKAAEGFVDFFSEDGNPVRSAVAVAGYGLRDEEDAALVVLASDEGLGAAIVRPRSDDTQLWDVKFPGVRGEGSFVFVAEGEIDSDDDEGRCEPANDGDLTIARVGVFTPLQLIDPPGSLVELESDLMILRKNQARGFIDAYTSQKEVLTYEAFYGESFRDRDTDAILHQFLLLLDNPDSSNALSTDTDLLIATVGEDAITPDCQIWDLINGESGAANGMFETNGVVILNGSLPGGYTAR